MVEALTKRLQVDVVVVVMMNMWYSRSFAWSSRLVVLDALLAPNGLVEAINGYKSRNRRRFDVVFKVYE